MKKLLVAIVALLYISTSTGATLHLHYCMGKLAGWGLWYNKSNTCGRCGMEKSEEKNSGCCKDEQRYVKNTTDQKTTEVGLQMLQVMEVALPVSFIEIPANDFRSVIEQNPISHARPGSGGIAVYIRNCIFLI